MRHGHHRAAIRRTPLVLVASALLAACGSKADERRDEGKAALKAFREFVAKTYTERLDNKICTFRSDVRATNAVEQPYEGLLHTEVSFVDSDGKVNPFNTKLDLVYDRTSEGWKCSETKSTAAQNDSIRGGADACLFVERMCQLTPERERELKRGALRAPLNLIGKLAKDAYNETGRFPVGTVQLSPAMPCCSNTNHKCSVDDSAWSAPIWQQLGFRPKEPTSMQFSYTSDGRKFTALAVGDPDCNGDVKTFELLGEVISGNPSVSLNERAQPPPSVATSNSTATTTQRPTSVSIAASASSTHKPGAGYTFDVANVLDGDVATSWQPRDSTSPAWVQLDFAGDVTVTVIKIANGFQASDRLGDEFVLNSRIAKARLRFSDNTEMPIEFSTDARGLVPFKVPSKSTRSITVLVDRVFRGSRWDDLAISEIEVETLSAPRGSTGGLDIPPADPTAQPPPRHQPREQTASAHSKVTCHEWFNMSASEQARTAVEIATQVRNDYQRKTGKTVEESRPGDYVAFANGFTVFCKQGVTEDMYTVGMLTFEAAFATP